MEFETSFHKFSCSKHDVPTKNLKMNHGTAKVFISLAGCTGNVRSSADNSNCN
jgi:hypothetical protein